MKGWTWASADETRDELGLRLNIRLSKKGEARLFAFCMLAYDVTIIFSRLLIIVYRNIIILLKVRRSI